MNHDIPDADVDYLSLRAEIGLPLPGGRLNEAHLPPAERRGHHAPFRGCETYRRRATAPTDRTMRELIQLAAAARPAPRPSRPSRLRAIGSFLVALIRLPAAVDRADHIIARQPSEERRRLDLVNRDLAGRGL